MNLIFKAAIGVGIIGMIVGTLGIILSPADPSPFITTLIVNGGAVAAATYLLTRGEKAHDHD